MSYEEQSERYHDPAQRSRYEMCIREQAQTFSENADPANASLGRAIVGGDPQAIDNVMAAICVGPNSAQLGNDPDLLAAVQAAWPVVAGSSYDAA